MACVCLFYYSSIHLFGRHESFWLELENFKMHSITLVLLFFFKQSLTIKYDDID